MKNTASIKYSLLSIVLAVAFSSKAQNPVNWTSQQLIEPADLAKTINTKKDLPVIISVGPGAVIPGSLPIGMVNTAEGLDKLKKEVSTLPKEKAIVIYCGCC